MSKDTSQSGLVDNLIGEFRESLRRDGLHHSTARFYAKNARHFVVWLENEGARLAEADDGLLQRFARHSCECAGMADRKWPAGTPQMSAAGAVRFVRFLEARDIVRHPGELAEGFRLAEAFAQSLRTQGFQPSTADTYRQAHVHSFCPLAAPVQDPVGAGRRRRGGAVCRSRVPVPGTAVASTSQALPRPEGRSEGRLASRARAPMPQRRSPPGGRTGRPLCRFTSRFQNLRSADGQLRQSHDRLTSRDAFGGAVWRPETRNGSAGRAQSAPFRQPKGARSGRRGRRRDCE